MPLHIRQFGINYGNIKRRRILNCFLKRSKSIAAAYRFTAAAAPGHQLIPQHKPVNRVFADNKDTPSTNIIDRGGSRFSFCGLFFQHDGKPECGALPFNTVNAYFTPHELNQPFRNGKAKPRSAETPRHCPVNLGKRLKKAAALLLGYAYACIGD